MTHWELQKFIFFYELPGIEVHSSTALIVKFSQIHSLKEEHHPISPYSAKQKQGTLVRLQEIFVYNIYLITICDPISDQATNN